MSKHDPVYIMLKRKLVIAWVVSYVLLLVLALGSYQYSNYVFRQLCGLISISDTVYKNDPPKQDTGKSMAHEFERLTHKYHCTK